MSVDYEGSAVRKSSPRGGGGSRGERKRITLRANTKKGGGVEGALQESPVEEKARSAVREGGLLARRLANLRRNPFGGRGKV